MLLGISIGTVSVPVLTILKLIGSEVLHLPFMGKTDPMFTTIVMDIRLPRVILAGLVGASLAIAGAAFQGLLTKPISRSIRARRFIRSIRWSGTRAVFQPVIAIRRHVHPTSYEHRRIDSHDFPRALSLHDKSSVRCAWRRSF